MTFTVGDVATLEYALTVDGTARDATVTLTVTRPDGTTAPVTVDHADVGAYTADLPLTQSGTWSYAWAATGAATDAEVGSFTVDDAGLAASLLRDLRLALDITVDDGLDVELQRMLNAAKAEYEQYVGPIAALPANHAEEILTDVEELWSRTQRGDATGRPGFGGEGSESEPVRPLVLFPRIRKLRGATAAVGSFPAAADWPCW